MYLLVREENSIFRSEPLEVCNILLVIISKREGITFYGCLYSSLFPCLQSSKVANIGYFFQVKFPIIVDDENNCEDSWSTVVTRREWLIYGGYLSVCLSIAIYMCIIYLYHLSSTYQSSLYSSLTF